MHIDGHEETGPNYKRLTAEGMAVVRAHEAHCARVQADAMAMCTDASSSDASHAGEETT